MTKDEARKKLFSMMREDELHAKTLVNYYADQFESLRKQASKSRMDEFMQELDRRAEDEMPISRLRRDARATVSDLIECCSAWDTDACIAIAPLPARLVPQIRRTQPVLHCYFLQVVAFDAAIWPCFHHLDGEGAKLFVFVRQRER